MIHHTLMKTGFVPVTGGQIHYRCYEPHDLEKTAKTPVLMIHGGPGACHALMYDCLAQMADERICLYYDQLGSHFSPAEMTPEWMTVERYADEITRLLDAAGYEKVILFGHSWGGALAAHYILKHPHRVAGLVLSCPLLSTARWIADCNRLLAALPQQMQDTIRQCEAAGTTDSAAYKEADAYFLSIHLVRSKDQGQLLAKHRGRLNGMIYNYMWGPSEFSCRGTLHNFDVFDRLGEIKVPTLLICGAYDTATPETMGEAQRLIAGSDLAIVPDSGHLAFVDNNEAYLAAVEAFMAKNGF